MNNVTHFVTVAYSSGHFAVLYFDISNQHVSIYDGLNCNIMNWQNIINIVKTNGLKLIGSQAQCQYSEEVKAKRKEMLIEVDFHNGNAP